MKRGKLPFAGKILSFILCVSLVFASVQLPVFAAGEEDSITKLVTAITENGLSAEIDATNPNVINVTGNATNDTSKTTIEIPEGVTVNWEARFDGNAAGYSQLLIVQGAGVFHLLKDGSITNTGAGNGDCAIYLENSVTANISGKVSGNVGIFFADTAMENATVNITGGEVIGEALGIQNSSNSNVKINISDGKVSSTTGAAIDAGNGTVTLSGTTEITSEKKSGIVAKTIQVTGGTSQVTGGASGIDLSSDGSSLTIAKGATLSVKGTKGSGIAPNGSTIEVQGILNAAGEGNASEAYGIGTMNPSEGTLKVTGGVVNATGATGGISVSIMRVNGGVLRATGQDGPGIYVEEPFSVQGNRHIVGSGDRNYMSILVDGAYYWYEGDDKPTSSDDYILNGEIAQKAKQQYIEFISVGHLTKKDNKDGTHTLTCDSNCPESVTITERHHYGYYPENNDACLCGALPAAKTMVSGNDEPVWYDTFADALDAANRDDFTGTLFLLQDTNLGDEKADFTNEKVTLNLNGKTITGTVVVKGSTLTLVENSAGGQADFELTSGKTIIVGSALTGTYSVALLDENSNAAAGTFAKVQSDSNVVLEETWFTSANEDFEIVEEENGSLALKKRIADAAVKIEPESGVYTGEAFTPAVSVTWKEQTLTEGTDYELTWSPADLINVGTYTATITGKGDYTGEKTGTFSITKADPAYTVPAGITAVYGQPLSSVNLSVVPGGTAGTWSWENSRDIVGSVGEQTHKAVFTPEDTQNYNKVTVDVKIQVGIADLSTGSVEDVKDQIYTGQAHTPTLTVKDVYGNLLVAGTDYMVGYSNHVNAGEATATITGVGNYQGTITKTFDITPKTLENPAIEGIEEEYTYTGSSIRPDITVKDEDTVLNKGTDYTVTYGDNKNASEGGTVTVTLKGNYSGRVEKTFKITKKQLTWNTADLTASKRQDDTGEATVYGILAVDGIVNDELTFTSPADMKTSGLTDQTAADSYLVSVVPENGNWGFTQPEPENYIWPDGNPTITATVNQVVETPVRPSELPEGTDTEKFKVEMESGISSVPDDLKNTDYDTPTKIENVLKAKITQMDSGISAANTAVYDVTLMISTDNGQTWKKAEAEDFPANGLTVTLPYPSGTGKSTHDFVVIHMFTTNDFGKKPGDTEQPAVTKTDDGIRFKVTGLSPVSVGWKEITKAADTNTGGGSEISESSDVDDRVYYELIDVVPVSPAKPAATLPQFPAPVTDHEEEETEPLTTGSAEADTEESAEEVQEAVEPMQEEEKEQEEEKGKVPVLGMILIVFIVLAVILFFILFWKRREEE